MRIEKILKSGTRAAIIVRSDAEKRLRTTCFRGTSAALAGNFLRFKSADELFCDPEVMEDLLAELDELWLEQDFATHSLSIDHTMHVGWESTAPRENYDDDALEQFTLNRKSSGLRVKLSRTDLLAPKTHQLTIVYEFRFEFNMAFAIVHSIYPGADVGELIDDVSERERRVFFNWDHPGAV